MKTTVVGVTIPVGRKALVVTNNVRYDNKGNWLGHEVIEVEQTFDRAEAERLQQILGCVECGGIGEHKSYFVKTGQCGGGSVEGYTKRCTRAPKV